MDGEKFDLALAGKVEITSDKNTIRVYITDGAKFSNGDKITSEDVLASLNNIPIEKNFTSEITDEKVFTLNFKKNEGQNPLQVLTYPIVSKKEKFEENFSKNLITSSPYSIHSISKDSDGNITKMSLKRFNNGEIKLPYLKYFSITFFTDETEALTALQRGEIDTLSGVPGKIIAKLKEDTNFKLNTSKLPNNFALFINQNKNEFLQLNSGRQMLGNVLDRQSLVNQVLGGFGVPEKNILGEDRKPETPENILKNLNSLLSYKDGVLYMSITTEDKKASAKDVPVTLSITTIDNKELLETAEFVANSWKKLGIEVTIKKIDRKELQRVVKDRDFDILLFGFSIKNNADYYSFFSSKERTYPKLNISNYTNKKADSALENLQTETNPKNILELKSNLSKELETDSPIIMLYKPLFVQAISSPHTMSIPENMLSEEDRYRFYKDWYLHTEKVLKFFVNSALVDKLDQILN